MNRFSELHLIQNFSSCRDLALLHCPVRLMCLLGTVDGESPAAAAALNPYVGFGNRLEAVVRHLPAAAASAAATERDPSATAAARTASALLAAYEHGAAEADCEGVGDECPLEDYFLLEAQSERGGKARTVRRRRRGRRKREARGPPPARYPGKGAGTTKENAAGGQRRPHKRRRSKAVHRAGARRQSPNRRAWLNVSCWTITFP